MLLCWFFACLFVVLGLVCLFCICFYRILITEKFWLKHLVYWNCTFACILACFVFFLSDIDSRKKAAFLTEALCALEFHFVYCMNKKKTSVRRWAYVPWECFIWRRVSHFGVPKQSKCGHISVSNQFCGIWTFFFCQDFLLYQLMYKAAGHVGEKALYTD